MKATGIVRRIDDLGRVVIPKEIRRTIRIREGDPSDIHTEKSRGETSAFCLLYLFFRKGVNGAFFAEHAVVFFQTQRTVLVQRKLGKRAEI